ILVGQEGGLATLIINRPRALNALTLENYRRIDPTMRAWAADPSVHAVAIRGASDRAFCAGGDVRAVYEAGLGIGADPELPAVFFREEYELIRFIHHFPKPYIAIMDGITMGGGAGISVNGGYRIATERTLFADARPGAARRIAALDRPVLCGRHHRGNSRRARRRSGSGRRARRLGRGDPGGAAGQVANQLEDHVAPAHGRERLRSRCGACPRIPADPACDGGA